MTPLFFGVKRVCSRVIRQVTHAFWYVFSPQENVAAVNEALSELYIEDEDHEKLRESVDDYDNFDQVRRAARVCVACCRTQWRPFAVPGKA